MRSLQVAVIGLGRLGRACGEALLAAQDLHLAGFVRRNERLSKAVPGVFRDVPKADHVEALGQVDAALLCVPSEHAVAAAHDLLQHGIPMAECAGLHGEAFQDQKDRLHRLAAD